MGWGEGYRIMEQQVICLYDKGLLNKEILDSIMEPFKNTDIDLVGSQDLKANDGKSADDIICFIMEPEKYQEIIENYIPNPEECGWNEELYELYYEIVQREWEFQTCY